MQPERTSASRAERHLSLGASRKPRRVLPALEKLTRYCLGQWVPADKAQLDALDGAVRRWIGTELLEQRKERDRAPLSKLMRNRMASFIRRGYAPPTRQKSLLTGSAVAGSHVPLLKWFRAIGLFVATDGGISALQLMTALKLGNYGTAMGMLSKIRTLACGAMSQRPVGGARVFGLPAASIWPGMGAAGAGQEAVILCAVESSQNVRTILLRLARSRDEAYEQRRLLAAGSSDPRHKLDDQIPPDCRKLADELVAWLKRIHRRPPSLEKLQPYLDEFAFRLNVKERRQERQAIQALIHLAVGLKVREVVEYFPIEF